MSAQLDRLNVCIFNGNAKMARLLKTVVRTFGFGEVGEACTLDKAKRVIIGVRPDFILCSPHLEDGSGYDLIHWIRNDSKSPCRTAPIIMCSSKADRDGVMDAIRAGCDEFLSMPIVPKDLYKRIEAVILRPRAYVNVPGYFGPCRRRADDPAYKGPEQRSSRLMSQTG